MLLACYLVLASCNDKDIEPVTGYNSKIEINNITLTGIGMGASVTGYLSREYIIATDTTPLTQHYTDSFEVEGNGYNQTFHFNTPSKATTCNMQVKFKVWGSTASTVSVASFYYYKDESTVFAKTPLEISGEGRDFHSDILTVDF